MRELAGRTAVVTGAASGLGLEFARLAARGSMNVVMADVQADALARAVPEIEAIGAGVLPLRVDVARAAEVEAMAAAVRERFGAPNLVFNNAGVGCGGPVWEQSLADWEWVLGVNLMGVVHGLRAFTPMMLEAARRDPAWEGHIVNTASMAGLINAPLMGVYNVSKHAVVSLSETLFHDLSLVTEQVGASVLCPSFVPTAIGSSERNRPPGQTPELTRAQQVGKALTAQAVSKGTVSAAEVARLVFDAIRERRFYIYTHPRARASVQTRLEDVVRGRNPTDPFAGKPEIGAELRAALRDP